MVESETSATFFNNDGILDVLIQMEYEARTASGKSEYLAYIYSIKESKLHLLNKFGEFLDPLADKLLVLSAFYGFMFLPILSTTVKLWMIILISFRDIIVTLMRTFMQYKGLSMITSKAGKLKTFLQIITINFILIYLILKSYKVDIPTDILQYNSLYFLMVITTMITFYTGIHYVYNNYKTLGNLFFNK